MKQGEVWLGAGTGVSAEPPSAQLQLGPLGIPVQSPSMPQQGFKPALQYGHSSARVLGGGEWAKEAPLQGGTSILRGWNWKRCSPRPPPLLQGSPGSLIPDPLGHFTPVSPLPLEQQFPLHLLENCCQLPHEQHYAIPHHYMGL